MKSSRGRINSFPLIFNSYKKDMITIQLTKEKIVIGTDGEMRRSKYDSRGSSTKRYSNR